MAGRQGREELIKKGLLEMMEQGEWGCCLGGRGAGPGSAEPGISHGPRGLLETEWELGVWCPWEAGPAGVLHGWGSPRVLTYGLRPRRLRAQR